jgi:hypothetical protein
MKKYKFPIIALVLFPLLFFSCKTVELTAIWDPNTEADMSHYNLYWYYQGDYQMMNDDPIVHPTTSHTFTLELPDDFNEELCFVATAVNTSGNESDYSNMACVEQ